MSGWEPNLASASRHTTKRWSDAARGVDDSSLLDTDGAAIGMRRAARRRTAAMFLNASSSIGQSFLPTCLFPTMFRATGLRSTWTRHRRAAELVAGGALLVSAPLFLQKVKNDVKVNSRSLPTGPEAAGVSEKDLLIDLTAYTWGTNASSSLLTPGSSSDSRKIPTETRSLSGVALRDVIIHETLSTLVDASGDVYHWDVTTNSTPTCVLKGKVGLTTLTHCTCIDSRFRISGA